MHGYLRPGDVARTWGGVVPQGTGRAAQLRSPDGAIPYVMVLLFLFAMYGVVAENIPALRPLRPALTLGLTGIALLLIERTMSGRSFRLPWPEGHALLAFLGVAGLSTFNALWPGLAAESTMDFAKVLVLYVLIVNVVSTRARLRGLIWTMVLAGVMPAQGTIQNHLAGNFVEGDRAAWVGKYAGPNEVAFELAILVPLALAMMFTARWWGKLLLGGVLGTYLAAILFTYSRSGLLGLGGMAAVGIFRLRSHGMRTLAVVVVILAVAVGGQLWEREETLEDLNNDYTFNQRLDSMKKGLAMFQSRPFFGIGLGCSPLGAELFAQQTDTDVADLSIHNTVVEALAETGLVGFTLLAIATLVVMRRMRALGAGKGGADLEMRAYATAIELSFVAFLVAGLANGFIGASAPYLLIALGSATWGVAMAERQLEAV